MIVCGLYEWKKSVQVLLSFVYICCRWRSNYQGGVGILLTSLTLATFLCLSQARTWISNVICSRLSLCSMIWCPIQFADLCQCWQILEPSFVARDIKVIINTWQQQFIFIWGVIGRFHLIVKLSAICCYVNFGFSFA